MPTTARSLVSTTVSQPAARVRSPPTPKNSRCSCGDGRSARPGRPERSAAVTSAGVATVTSPVQCHELSTDAILATPRCHPDGAAIRRVEKAAALAERGESLRTENREPHPDLRTKITFDALGWRMAERVAAAQLAAGDAVDIAFTVGHNDHPEYGGIELSLRDFKTNVR